MDKFLNLQEIEAKCGQLNEKYQIEEEKFYRVVEKWAEQDLPVEERLAASFRELLQVVTDEINGMQTAVELSPSCRMGCAFCCYFPIIINGMEAKLMKQAIASFPKERQQKLKNHFQQYFETYGSELEEITSLDFEEDKDFKLKYRKSNVPCMMLDTETNQCLAYEIRPIPCRTYVNYADPKVCEENLMPKETISFEFLYNEYMGAWNEFVQYLYEYEETAFLKYPDDVYAQDYIANWFREKQSALPSFHTH